MDYQEKLLAKKNEIEQIIRQKQDSLMIPITESTDELSMYDQHPADIASELYEREKDNGMLELLQLELEKVNDALEKLSNGEYGKCDSCGREIEPERLERLLNTTLCVSCARDRENKFTRPAEEDVTRTGDMADRGETLDIAGYEFYE